MLYKNTKTGAIIDTPCKVKGGNWIEVVEEEREVEEETEKEQEEGEETQEEIEEESEEVIELSKMTVNNLKNLAAEHDIKLGNATKKDEIIKAIMESDAFEVE